MAKDHPKLTHRPDKAREAARIAARFFVGAEAADVAIDAFLAASVPADDKIAEISARHIELAKHWFHGGSTLHDDVGTLLTLVTALSAKQKEDAATAANLLRDIKRADEEVERLSAKLKEVEADRDQYAETVLIISPVLSRMGAPGPGKWKDLIYQAEQNFNALKSELTAARKALEEATADACDEEIVAAITEEPMATRTPSRIVHYLKKHGLKIVRALPAPEVKP